MSNKKTYKIYPCKKCGRIELSTKNKSGLCRSCRMIGNKITLGWKMPDKQKKHLSKIQKKENNSNWKGDNVGYNALHRYITNYYKKPNKCECCKKEKPYDLANIGGYTRDLKNWKWLCRRCHMLSDGRMLNLKQYAKKKIKSK